MLISLCRSINRCSPTFLKNVIPRSSNSRMNQIWMTTIQTVLVNEVLPRKWRSYADRRSVTLESIPRKQKRMNTQRRRRTPRVRDRLPRQVLRSNVCATNSALTCTNSGQSWRRLNRPCRAFSTFPSQSLCYLTCHRRLPVCLTMPMSNSVYL